MYKIVLRACGKNRLGQPKKLLLKNCIANAEYLLLANDDFIDPTRSIPELRESIIGLEPKIDDLREHLHQLYRDQRIQDALPKAFARMKNDWPPHEVGLNQHYIDAWMRLTGLLAYLEKWSIYLRSEIGGQGGATTHYRAIPFTQLAEGWEKVTGQKPGITFRKKENSKDGHFVSFVQTFMGIYMPDRAISGDSVAKYLRSYANDLMMNENSKAAFKSPY